MKALEEIIIAPRPVKTGVDLKDYYGMARQATLANDMTTADFDGIGQADEYIPGLDLKS